ncbi:MAG: hypothetical protein COV74_03565 [Candidatus Omnitrophica bacterium CG11_big_fil_rev_8_21_14_0_20_45_26]|uniref:Uncharacterized protein n=1 Tax=Candidatus Abzuiibacterium crystallinum TaxID=1974748 RepID=A0A2H0LQN1_9BACT|nr:MAG: hypothetical protein COV74_03565 [Candidatus Omnitrophica bacterium CG11_big_fil_rev_8_21_14_0_20_45_26]PIW63514.1 MAG: hypothetical protein COW12_10140 [Candidatus Omnitrophica bacterium CG12_big_fil_rev_8_21_14_0_65_45_16]
MIRKNIIIKLSIITLFLTAAYSMTLYATITNEGNETVEVMVKRTDGSPRKMALFPGQSTMLPNGAAEVSIVAGKQYGDEIYKVKVIDKTGQTRYIEKVDKPLVLGKQAEDTIVKKIAKVENAGNLEVILSVLRSDGRTETLRVRPEHTVKLSEEAVAVTTSSNAIIRGDEIIDLKITLPNGESKSINALGATVRLDSKT